MHPLNKPLFIIVLGIALAIFNITQAIFCDQSLGCIGDYWGQFWITSYTDGYTRRGFLGETLRSLFGPQISFIALNLVCLAIAFLILVFSYGLYFRAKKGASYWPLLCALVLSGPSTSLLFEVLGDPLQVSMALVIVYLFLQGNVWVARFFGILIACLVVAIHEAAIFLMLPALFLIYALAQKKTVHWLGIALTVFIIAIGYSVFFNHAQEMQNSMAIITKNGQPFRLYGGVLPDLMTLLQEEWLANFSSVKSVFYMLLKILRVSLWPLLAITLLSVFLKDGSLLKRFIFLLILSLPLYFIAHDWGRFEIYTFLLSLSLGTITHNQKLLPFWLDSFCQNLLQKITVRPLLLAFLPFFFLSYGYYRDNGLSLANTLYLLCALMLFWFLSSFAENNKPCEP
jgi:hypothetical protein